MTYLSLDAVDRGYPASQRFRASADVCFIYSEQRHFNFANSAAVYQVILLRLSKIACLLSNYVLC